MKNKIEWILEHIKSILFVVQRSSSKVKYLNFFLYLLVSIVLILGILELYGSVVYSDSEYIWKKDSQRFAIDGESLDLSSQFKEIDLFIDTEINYLLTITSSDFLTEEITPEVTIFDGDGEPKIYENVNIKVYTNGANKFVFNINTPQHVWFHSKPDNNWIRLELTKDDKFSKFEIYELNISNIEYNKELNLFVRSRYGNSVELKDSEVTIITSAQKEEKIHVKKGYITLNGISAIRFYNVSNILARNISGIDFNENTKIDSLNFTNGFGTFALGQSHFQFTPIDEIQIVSSENISPVKLKVDLVRKTFKASGFVNSSKFNGNENILANYQIILRDPAFISAIVGAIIGGLFAFVATRKDTSKNDVTFGNGKTKRIIFSRYMSNRIRNQFRKKQI